MNNECIEIRNAYTNNLKKISLKIPHNRITVFCGVSGSGKTSLVFDTVAAEAMRQLYDTFPLYVRNRMPYYPRPKAEEIKNLTTAVVIDQKIAFGDARSTVGTITETSPLLRLLFSRFSSGEEKTSKAFSFNDPEGMCPVCMGIGMTTKFDYDRILDRSKSLNQGAIMFPGFMKDSYQWQMYANSGVLDPDKPLEKYSEKEWDFFLHGKDHIVDIKNNTGHVWDSSYKLTYEGFADRLDRLYLKKAHKVNGNGENSLQKFTTETVCPACNGKRLNEKALSCMYNGYSIWDMGELEIDALVEFLKDCNTGKENELVLRILSRLKTIQDIGLGYLNLNRGSCTLSGGETQRLKMVRYLGSSLTGMTYIFDEPSIGLHPKDITRLNSILMRLKERGNTILIVEHDEEIMKIADEIVEIGPEAGKNGGKIIFQGRFEDLKKASTPTGKWLRGEYSRNGNLKKFSKNKEGWISLEHCRMHNLKDISVKIPENALTVVTGAAGAGKTTLAVGELCGRFPKAVAITQSPIGTNIRSNPASYIGIMDDIRKLFAAENKTKPSLYSFNSKGACPVCSGKGTVTTEMAYMDPVTLPCEACGGTRYNKEALKGKFKGKTIVEVLDMTVDEAMGFFEAGKIRSKLGMLKDVGLGYLRLGQPTSALSGGECQRIKLAAHMSEKNGIYILDEPACGLHGKDIALLNILLRKLADNGNTVIVAEHRYDVILNADYIIDLGPEAGRHGGEVLFEGALEDFVKNGTSCTAEYLRRKSINM